MPSGTKVLRTFFVDPHVDMRLAHLALVRNVSKNELTRVLLHRGMLPYIDGKESIQEGIALNLVDDSDGKDGMVLRSIYLTPDFDDYLRKTAFDLRCSKGQLMRRFISHGIELLELSSPAVAERPPPAPHQVHKPLKDKRARFHKRPKHGQVKARPAVPNEVDFASTEGDE